MAINCTWNNLLKTISLLISHHNITTTAFSHIPNTVEIPAS